MADNENTKVTPEEETKETPEDVAEETNEAETPSDDKQPEEAEAEKSELDKAKEQIAGLSDKLIRKAAEFENFKKRTAKEKEDFYKMAVC